MNFFDTYDITRGPTPQPPAEGQPSLNEEMTEVIGQLGRFWGGFRKQSQQVLEIAKKDLGDVVVQAQKELGRYTGVPETTEAGPSARSVATSADPDAGTSESKEEPTESALDSVPANKTLDPDAPVASSSTSAPASLFSRLQSAIPPNLIATVQSHIPESIKHASENIDFAQIQSNLVSEFQRVQGITRAQAEEYAHKSEALLREAMKEASEALKDAVKIIPPEEQEREGQGETGLVWDGTDMWMLPTNNTSADADSNAAGPSKQPGETQTAVASRALALLSRLQSDPSIVSRDPEAEEGTKDQYKKWLADEVDAKDGIDGSEWSGKSEELLKDNTALYEMYASLVPSGLTKEVFWSRYFFRAHQIKLEEERRKALIQSTAESDEDFSWEDDEEEEGSDTDSDSESGSDSTDSEPSAKPAQVAEASKSTQASDSNDTSPRVSSEDSFDVVSSNNASVAGDKKPPKSEEADEDSDWE
ncbi:hypothetical protein FA15DRAFT_680934 [Coprinopsis marcescibilis]|uniref:BSD domain-containing protein n=1 Tax=Coprinopsis marcescibilis TaxID=230819 RepID=A0A5C3KTI3_COPMA|nr:hypothetical protein FA15DRAFT_680934 [Coprinopsis marcescibilis]